MSVDFDRWKRSFLFHWILNNIAGFGVGAVLGEYAGHLIEKPFGWQVGLLIAGIIFEAVIWGFRFLTIINTIGFSSFRSLDTIIWLSAEGIGFLFAEGIYIVADAKIMVLGPMIGSVLGSFILLLFWIIRIPSPQKRYWAFQSVLYGVIGLFIISFAMSATYLLILEISKILSSALNQLWGLGIFSIFTGAIIGAVTGFGYLNLNIIRSYESDAI